MFRICGVLRFRGNWGLWALITIATLKVPAVQGCETLPGRGTEERRLRCPLCPTAACTGWGDPSNQKAKRCLGKGNWREAQDWPSLGEMMNDAHFPKPPPQTQECSTSGWQERGTWCPEIKQAGRRFCSTRQRSCCSHLLWHKWNGFYFETRRLK